MFMFILSLFRSLWKASVHFVTRSCEIERICRSETPTHVKTQQLDTSLKLSKQLKDVYSTEICRSFDPETVFREIVERKRIVLARSYEGERLKLALLKCLGQLRNVNGAIEAIASRCRRQYDPDDPEDVGLLETLWDLYMDTNTGISGSSVGGGSSEKDESEKGKRKRKEGDEKETSEKTKSARKWQELGFQGNTPQRDLRGMGMLGIELMVYFAKQHTVAARGVLFDSMQPQNWYPMAVSCLNIGFDLVHMAEERLLNRYFYEEYDAIDAVETFSVLFCHVMTLFNMFWKENGFDVMDFNQAKKKFFAKYKRDIITQDILQKIRLA